MLISIFWFCSTAPIIPISVAPITSCLLFLHVFSFTVLISFCGHLPTISFSFAPLLLFLVFPSVMIPKRFDSPLVLFWLYLRSVVTSCDLSHHSFVQWVIYGTFPIIHVSFFRGRVVRTCFKFALYSQWSLRWLWPYAFLFVIQVLVWSSPCVDDWPGPAYPFSSYSPYLTHTSVLRCFLVLPFLVLSFWVYHTIFFFG